MVKAHPNAQQALLASPMAAVKGKGEREVEMKQQVPTWLAVIVIVLVLAIIGAIFWLSGRQRSEQMPAGFKPQPPQFKVAPTEKR